MAKKNIYKNPTGLKKAIFSFVSDSKSIILLVPFIKIRAFKEIFSSSKVGTIVTRWNPNDLILGSSDLELFEYCVDNNITLYRNSKLHLKAFLRADNKAFIGSMNISERAISDNSEFFNYEIGIIVEQLNLSEKLYFQEIIHDSELIDRDKYELIKAQVEDHRKDLTEYPSEFDFSSLHELEEHYEGSRFELFLLSALPMLQSPERFKSIYFGEAPENMEEENCFIHDFINYKIGHELSENDFWETLKQSFFKHPFITAFLEYLEIKKTRGFTEISIWFTENTTTVPIPRTWELKENTRILYNWIDHLSDGKYRCDNPDYRQRLYCYDYYKFEVLPEYILKIQNLNIDTGRGFESINKPALLLSVIDAFEQKVLKGKVYLNQFVLNRFQEYWERYSKSNAQSNAFMPLYHLQSDGIWEIIPKRNKQITEQIRSSKQYNELVHHARMNDDFYGLMVVSEFRETLKKVLLERYFSQ